MGETTLSSRRAQTQERLIGAALQVIAERGAQAASVEQICEAAGFTRGAFYSNFSDKDDLMTAVVHHWFTEQLAAAQEALLETASSPASLTHDVRGAVRLFMQVHSPASPAWGVIPLELRLYALRNADFAQAFAEAEAEVSALIGDALTTTLASRGLELTVAPAEALDLLAAIFTFSRIGADDTVANMEERLSRVLLTLVQPRTEGVQPRTEGVQPRTEGVQPRTERTDN